MTFVDSSALVAILAPEADGETYANRIDEKDMPTTSSLAIFETVLALARIRYVPVAEAMLLVLEFLERGDVGVTPIGEDAHILAVGAHARFGKGTGHPARLNMGDCFSYALAKQTRAELLYKGDDFAHTDLA
jgi:ribonuclease VapC